MKATKVLAAALFSVAASTAFAGTGNAATTNPAQYTYGAELDVAKVISLTDVSRKTGVVPVTMVYEDSQGDVHQIQFQQIGGKNNSG